MIEYAYYNPEILKWARERVGYSIEDAAQKLCIKNPNKLAQAEQNGAKLTVNQLNNAAKKYSLPVPYFYLDTIPNIERKQTQSFRLNTDDDFAYTPEINKALIWAQDVRDDALWLAEEGHMNLPEFQWKISSKANIAKSALNIREALDAGQTRHMKIEQALKWWKSAVESTGVLVFETEHHQKFRPSGAAIYFNHAPVILLNGEEPYARKKLFTLMHEFSHLLIGDSSLDEFQIKINQSDAIEKRCNNLARQLLLPDEILYQAYNETSEDKSILSRIEHISRDYGVSRFVVVLALREKNMISLKVFRTLYKKLDDDFARYQKSIAIQRAARKSSGGPPPPVKKSKKLGGQYSRAVLSALWSGDLKQNQAVRMLDNLKVIHFEKFSERVFSKN